MYINVNVSEEFYNVYVNEIINGHKKTICFLHGWLLNSSTFDNVIDCLKDKYNIIAIDLPGFGKSDDLKRAFSLKDYAYVLESILKYYYDKLMIDSIYLLGHSFGGRVVIKYLNIFDNQFIKGLILCDSAGIRKKSFKRAFLICKYKLKKHVFKAFSYLSNSYKTKYNLLIKNSGSEDYKRVNDQLKGTMSLALTEDLFLLLRNIKVKTIVAWGKNDDITPLKDAYLMKKELVSSKLILFENSEHFPYISEEEKFVRVVNYALSDYFDS